MKSTSSYLAAIFFVLACLGWGLWIHDRLTQKNSAKGLPLVQVPEAQTTPPAPLNLTPPDVPTRDEWKEYFAARARVLRDNAEIALESAELEKESQAQQERLNAVMIQLNPQMAPLMAKLETISRLSAQAQKGVPPAQAAPSSGPRP